MEGTNYPRPDRSDYVPCLTRSADGILDFAWGEGHLRDGRPYRVEYWSDSGICSATFFLARQDLEFLDRLPKPQLARLLEIEGLVHFLGPTHCIIAVPWTDARQQALWSLNVVLSDPDEWFALLLVGLVRYPKPA